MNLLNRRNAIFTVAASLVASTFMLTSVAHAEDTLKNITQTKTVKIAILTDFPPFGMVGPDMKPQGYDIDLANLIANKLGAKPEFIVVSAANRIAYLQSHKVDILVASMAKSPEREKVIDFTVPYAPYYQAIYGQKSIPVKSYADLNGKTVAVARGTTQDDNLQKVAPEGTKIMRFEASTDAIQAVVSGQTQFIAMGSSILDGVLKQHPGLQLEFKLLLKNSPCYVAIRKENPDLLNKLNTIITDARKDGTLEKISQKWLHEGLDKLSED